MKKPQQKSAIVAGQRFYGATVKAAKATGETAVERLVREAIRGPLIYRFGACTAVIHADLHGWSYTIVHDSRHESEPNPVVATCSLSGTRDDVILSAANHAAQNQWRFDCPDDCEYVDSILAPLTSRLHPTIDSVALGSKRREFLDWSAWQRRYRAARDIGVGDNTAHDIASRTNSIDTARAEARRRMEALAETR